MCGNRNKIQKAREKIEREFLWWPEKTKFIDKSLDPYCKSGAEKGVRGMSKKKKLQTG